MPAGRSVVLVVNDDAALRELAVSVLQAEGYQVLEAEDGARALEIVRGTEVDAIILDVAMPSMDGPEFLRRYRELPIHHAPVIGMSVSGLPLDVDAWVETPFDLTQFLDVVQRQVGRPEAGESEGLDDA